MEPFMLDTNFVLLYVENPLASAAFYADLFETKPVESSPTFVMFVLEGGQKLGLWSRKTVEPAASITGGGAELAIPVATADAVRAAHSDWSRRKVTILQAPTQMDFGYTFTAADPDGHRLRVFTPAQA
jgi:predicted enzyme related to lactoylglutathione lyase